MVFYINIYDTFDVWRKKCNRLFEIIGDIDDAEFFENGMSTFVQVLNWMYNKLKNLQGQIGDITLLQTNDKSNLVNAINELTLNKNENDTSLRYAIIIG